MRSAFLQFVTQAVRRAYILSLRLISLTKIMKYVMILHIPQQFYFQEQKIKQKHRKNKSRNGLVVPPKMSRSTIIDISQYHPPRFQNVSQYHHKKIGLSNIMDETKATRSFQMLQLCRKVLDISKFHGQQLTLRFHTQQKRLCSKKTKNGKKRE